jgi:hypothetical protein
MTAGIVACSMMVQVHTFVLLFTAFFHTFCNRLRCGIGYKKRILSRTGRGKGHPTLRPARDTRCGLPSYKIPLWKKASRLAHNLHKSLCSVVDALGFVLMRLPLSLTLASKNFRLANSYVVALS